MKPKGILGSVFVAFGFLLFTLATARAQFSANFQTNTISGVSNWVSGAGYVVGSNTFSDALIIQSGGVLSNGDSYLGYEIAGSNNVAVVNGGVWSNRTSLSVGYFGAGNQLVVSNGGAVYNYYGFLGGFS